ncbi:MAG: Rdx family protein [Haloglomus sp.]
MTLVEIEYCAPCRLGAEATATRRVIADWLGRRHDLEVTCSPLTENCFCVSVDGDRVWCTDPGDRIDPFEAVAAVRSRLA